MRIKLIYPTWQRIQYQISMFASSGVAVVAALTPSEMKFSFAMRTLNPYLRTCRSRRHIHAARQPGAQAFAIADEYRAKGCPSFLADLP